MRNSENKEKQLSLLVALPRLLSVILFSLVVTFSFAQTRTVTGVVVDNTGEPVIGASVLVKGTTVGTITDFEGGFTLSVPANSTTLSVSFIGYETIEVSVQNTNSVKVTLSDSSIMLDEFVAIGYGTAKKGNVTGAIAKVNAEKLGDRPISDVSSALQGQMAGVEVRTTSGEPGKEIQIRVRGAASINAEADPLYVVDGVPVDNLSSLNPSDIESIEVLKDASSSAIYGSRGANGVVLVTTKRGSAGSVKVQFSANVGFQQMEKKLDLLSAEEWISYTSYIRNQAYVNAYGSSGATVNDSWDTRRNIIGNVNYTYMPDPRWEQDNYGGLSMIDWQKEFYRTAPMQDYQLSVSGGNKDSNFRISLGYLTQEGIATGSDYSRLNMRTNAETKILDRITIGMNIAPSVSWANGVDAVDGKDSQSHQLLAIVPVAEADAGIYTAAQPYERYMWAGSTLSPVAYMERTTNYKEIIRLNTSAYLKADIWNGISAEVLGAWDFYDHETQTYIPTSAIKAWSTTVEGEGSSATRLTKRTHRMLFQSLLHYNKTFDKHTVGAMLGYSAEEYKGFETTQKANNFPNDALKVFNKASSGTIGESEAKEITPERLMSYFGRIQYDYDSRYLLTGSLRRDGSSKFGKNNRWGWFPAVSAAWRISNEPFWSDAFVMNSLKLRGSWGANGNNAIPSTAAIGALKTANYPYGGTQNPGYIIDSTVNENLGWEKVESWNIAADFGLWNNRVYFSADYYVKNTKDLLYKVAVPSVLGYTTTWGNIGSMRNKGVELELSTQNIVGRSFQWSSTLNMGFNKNEITSLGEDNETVFTGFGNTQVLQVGKALNSFYMYKAVGVYQTQADLEKYPVMSTTQLGDVRYEDTDGNGVIDENDKTYLGDPSPKMTFGFTNTFRYKNMDLSILLTGQTGGKVYGLLGRAIDRTTMGSVTNALGRWRNMWRSEEEPGDGKTPSPTGTTGSLYDSRWLYSSDFIKIKNITFGYTIPIKKYIDYARVYVSAENVYMWDKYYGGYSPETNNVTTDGGAYDYGAYPQARTISFGVNVTF